MTTALDITAVQAFLLVADLRSFTRAAEVLGATQAAISMKLQRLENTLGKRLVERSPRSVQLTAEGIAFQKDARVLIAAHDRALKGKRTSPARLRLGISDHAAGPELVSIMERLRASSPFLTASVQIGFSRDLLDAFDAGKLDAVIVRREGSRRGGETLTEDEFGWFASPALTFNETEKLPLATLAAGCGVRVLAIRALDKARVPWSEVFVGGGVTAVAAAAQAGLGVAPLARRIAPPGLVDVGPLRGLPRLGQSKVMLYSKVADAEKLRALRTIAAAFRKIVRAA